MKRPLLLLLGLCLSLSNVCGTSGTSFFRTDAFGGTRLGLGNVLSVELAPQDPLYRPYLADPFSVEGTLQYLVIAEDSERPSYLYTSVKENGTITGLRGYLFDADYNQEIDEYIYMRAGLSVPFLRLAVNGPDQAPLLAVEGVVQGGIRTIFLAFGGTDQLGFDGTYFYGVNVGISDEISLQIGRKHFSSHIGDEMITRTIRFNTVSGHPLSDPALDPAALKDRMISYVRQDPLTYAVSVVQNQHVRLYGELRLGDTARIIRPNLAAEDDPLLADFQDREIQGGIELRLPVPLLGDLMLAADITLYENGKFLLVPVPDSIEYKRQYQEYEFVYDPEAPWDVEINLAVAQTLTTRKAGSGKLRLFAMYHQGRFPLHAFFMHRAALYTFGVSIGA